MPAAEIVNFFEIRLKCNKFLSPAFSRFRYKNTLTVTQNLCFGEGRGMVDTLRLTRMLCIHGLGSGKPASMGTDGQHKAQKLMSVQAPNMNCFR